VGSGAVRTVAVSGGKKLVTNQDVTPAPKGIN